LIVVSEQGLKKLGRKVSETVEVLTVTHSTGNLFEDGDYTRLETTKNAADKAYKESGLTAQQIQVAEVHDCFTIAEVLMYEALSFAEYGKGLELAKVCAQRKQKQQIKG
jgi:acetyl-CoA acyltransferase